MWTQQTFCLLLSAILWWFLFNAAQNVRVLNIGQWVWQDWLLYFGGLHNNAYTSVNVFYHWTIFSCHILSHFSFASYWVMWWWWCFLLAVCLHLDWRVRWKQCMRHFFQLVKQISFNFQTKFSPNYTLTLSQYIGPMVVDIFETFLVVFVVVD